MTALCGWLVVMVTVVLGPGADGPTDLAGHWVLETPVDAGLESVVPAWEEIAVDATGVTVTRGTEPDSTERYPFDDTDRQVTRVRGQARLCRAGWLESALVVVCRQTSRGPGGRAPDIVTRERRTLDAQGRMVLTVHWHSGTREAVRRHTFIRRMP